MARTELLRGSWDSDDSPPPAGADPTDASHDASVEPAGHRNHEGNEILSEREFLLVPREQYRSLWEAILAHL